MIFFSAAGLPSSVLVGASASVNSDTTKFARSLVFSPSAERSTKPVRALPQATYPCRYIRKKGLSRQAESTKRLSPLGKASVEVPDNTQISSPGEPPSFSHHHACRSAGR